MEKRNYTHIIQLAAFHNETLELDAHISGAGETAERFCGSVVHHLRLVRV